MVRLCRAIWLQIWIFIQYSIGIYSGPLYSKIGVILFWFDSPNRQCFDLFIFIYQVIVYIICKIFVYISESGGEGVEEIRDDEEEEDD